MKFNKSRSNQQHFKLKMRIASSKEHILEYRMAPTWVHGLDLIATHLRWRNRPPWCQRCTPRSGCDCLWPGTLFGRDLRLCEVRSPEGDMDGVGIMTQAIWPMHSTHTSTGYESRNLCCNACAVLFVPRSSILIYFCAKYLFVWLFITIYPQIAAPTAMLSKYCRPGLKDLWRASGRASCGSDLGWMDAMYTNSLVPLSHRVRGNVFRQQSICQLNLRAATSAATPVKRFHQNLHGSTAVLSSLLGLVFSK